ncbi:MAG: FadR family transcriptional regulator [Treponema sp.]|jgi:GntR family transcriptional repressor for pyruvate dehydrogenase complex|nr:FadR family transcriptional regulator [Treponema sp.]
MDTINYRVNKTNLYEQIAETLEQAIIGSEIKAEKLPSEQELSKRFDVSRTVIREALKVLKERGLIRSRNGGGSYVSKPGAGTISSAINRIVQMDNISNDDLHNLRLIMETAGARLAALNAGPEETEHLEDILEQMADESLPLEKRISLDADFHISIARASGNELLGVFVDIMTLLLKHYMSLGVFDGPRIRGAHRQHKRVLEAIKSRRSGKAERAIYDHLMAARKVVDQYEPPERKTKNGHTGG